VKRKPRTNSQPSTYTPRTLSRDLQQHGRLPLEQCLELGLTLSFALGHLHRHGLIHRDIKPSNIIFVGGVPKLADIGLVTEAEGANTFVGTEGFIPPEGPTSPQADLYALGKVLYEAAMGKDRNEFPEAFTQIGTDRESVALMELNAVLLRACRPDRKTRYASAEEMHADLAILHSGGSVKRRHRLAQQFRLVKQLGAAAIVAILLIGAAWFWQRQQTQQMTRLAAEKSELADANARLATEKGAAASESRRRLLQIQTGNGLRAMDENVASGSAWPHCSASCPSPFPGYLWSTAVRVYGPRRMVGGSSVLGACRRRGSGSAKSGSGTHRRFVRCTP
jgi:Protein kinase domain